MAEATLDLDAMQAELEGMSEEDLRKTLLDMKVKQKVTTGKYYNPERAKATRQKAAQKTAALVAHAKKLGIYDEINDQARKLADAKLAEIDADTEVSRSDND